MPVRSPAERLPQRFQLSKGVLKGASREPGWRPAESMPPSTSGTAASSAERGALILNDDSAENRTATNDQERRLQARLRTGRQRLIFVSAEHRRAPQAHSPRLRNADFDSPKRGIRLDHRFCTRGRDTGPAQIDFHSAKHARQFAAFEMG